MDKAAVLRCLHALRTGDRVLPPTAKECGAPITKAELALVINKLPTGKSPGPDRLPNKFYRTLSDVLSTVLELVFNESHQHGALARCWRRGSAESVNNCTCGVNSASLAVLRARPRNGVPTRFTQVDKTRHWLSGPKASHLDRLLTQRGPL